MPYHLHVRIQKVSPEGVQLFICFVFLVDEGKEHSYATISGPSTIHQRNAILKAFRWRAYDGPTFNPDLEAL